MHAKDAPALEAALQMKPAACKSRSGATFDWAQYAPNRPDGTPGRVESLLLFQCGLVMSREGYMSSSAVQLLVYDGEGRLEIAASPHYAAAYEWRAGDSGPVLARGLRSGSSDVDTKVEEAVAVAER